MPYKTCKNVYGLLVRERCLVYEARIGNCPQCATNGGTIDTFRMSPDRKSCARHAHAIASAHQPNYQHGCVLVRYCVDRYTLGSWQLAALACASGQTCTPD